MPMGRRGRILSKTIKYPDTLIIADMASAQRQDPNMNKNDDQAWLIGNTWIFIDKNKIITSTGPSQYDFK